MHPGIAPRVRQEWCAIVWPWCCAWTTRRCEAAVFWCQAIVPWLFAEEDLVDAACRSLLREVEQLSCSGLIIVGILHQGEEPGGLYPIPAVLFCLVESLVGGFDQIYRRGMAIGNHASVADTDRY